MKKKRRLVFVWNYLSWGGAQVYLLAIMKAARDDWNVVVHLPKASPPEIVTYLEQVGVPYKLVDYHLDPAPASDVAQKLKRQFNRILVELRTFRDLLEYDAKDTIFHIEIAPWQSVTFLSAMSLLRRAKVFLTLHNSLPVDAPAWRKLIWNMRLRFVARLPGIHFFASNVDTKTRLRGSVNDRFWDDIKVTYTAVNPPQIDEVRAASFDREAALRSHRISTEDFIVLGVGQFIDRKGRWVFLDAAQRVTAMTDDVTFVWLAPQLPSDDDQKRIAAYSLGTKFRLVYSGSLGDDRLDVLSFFRIADVFALPSYVEGLPIALLEAMALERPSISTNVYAIPEAVKHLQTGVLIEAGDADALAAAIMKLKDDEQLRTELGRNGREFVIVNFDERDAAATAIASYEEAMQRGR